MHTNALCLHGMMNVHVHTMYIHTYVHTDTVDSYLHVHVCRLVLLFASIILLRIAYKIYHYAI